MNKETTNKYTPPNPFKISEDLLGMLGKPEEVEEKTSLILEKQEEHFLRLLLATEIDSGKTSNTAKVVFNQILEKLNV